ncbi:rhodanese-like domain-containing protein [Thiohalomonas denitrificans]|uniref:rhodanese-like domain-containing protein n=1 Tax=Thiohalomonas denitrificans TaxID=415747 RepID=UPI0026F2D3DE|nr:rhodanese-like domain-containing protein [Thiohalomonas denitrificans]
MFNFKEIDAHQLDQMLNDDGLQVKLIDVRSPMEIAQGAIPGAEHIPLHLLPAQIDHIPEDHPVVFYCRTGARSGQACAYLSQLGRGNTLNLRGGVMAWVQGGLAVA